MEIDPTQIGLQVGGGAAIGGVIGYAAKKIIKLVAVLVGLELALFAYLENQGILSVNWSKLEAATEVTQYANGAGMPPIVSDFLSAAPMGGGFATGAVVGFKKG